MKLCKSLSRASGAETEPCSDVRTVAIRRSAIDHGSTAVYRTTISAHAQNYSTQPQQQQQLQLVNKQNPAPAVPPPAAFAQQPQQPAAYRPQQPRACFNCGDRSHFLINCPLKDRARKPIQQEVNSSHPNNSGGWTCPSNPHGMNHDMFPATLPTQGTVDFCINSGPTGHSACECMTPENFRQEEQVRAA